MRIALLAPATIQDFAPFLYEEYRDHLPKGMICSMITDLIKQYIQLGHEVVLCTLDSRIGKAQVYYGSNLTIFVGKDGTNPFIRTLSMLHNEVRQMADYLKNDCPPCDIYNAHWTYEFALAALEVDPKHTIVTIRDWAWTILKYNRNSYRFMRLLMAKKVFEQCDYYTANSQYIYDCMAKRYPSKKVVVSPNSIDLNLANTQEKQIRCQKYQIISVNNGFFEHKNGTTLLKAFKIIRKTYNDAELHLYGYVSENGGAAYRWAAKYGLSDGVFFHGNVNHDKIMSAIREADLLIHPSYEESFGLTLIEAMISKTPVIGGKTSGAVPWVLGEGKYGVLADVSKEEDIAQKACELLSDKSRWQMLMQTAYQYAIDTFNAGTMAKNYLKAYEWRLGYEER